jgi:DNA excision repair protein ERCC-4
MLVQIDSREKDRIQSATEYYKQQGLEVEVCELEIGDYIFDHKVCFEMKLIPDFIASIQEGRVFNQAITMAENYDWSFVMIHGDLYQRTKEIIKSKDYIPLTIEQYIGSISSLNRYTTVLQVYNSVIEEAYYTMMKQAEKCLSNRPIVKKFPKKHKNAAYNYLSYCIYGVSGKKAQAIVDELEISTLEDLLYLDHNQLTNIEGIGPKLADRIINTIQSETYE